MDIVEKGISFEAICQKCEIIADLKKLNKEVKDEFHKTT